MSNIPGQNKYEEFARVLDFLMRGKSAVIRGREGSIVQGLGEERLNILEILAMDDMTFTTGERISIGKESRNKIISVLGRLSYEELTREAKDQLPGVIEEVVKANEIKYIAYFNELQAITPRLHGLELIPGIGKTFMVQIIKQRQMKQFDSFDEIQERVGLREPARLIAKRIIEEISGGSRINLFVGR